MPGIGDLGGRPDHDVEGLECLDEMTETALIEIRRRLVEEDCFCHVEPLLEKIVCIQQELSRKIMVSRLVIRVIVAWDALPGKIKTMRQCI
jgi:hypothetical protein